MNAEQRRLAARMWKDGELVTKIAKALGVKVNRIYMMAGRYRHQFPHRQFASRRRPKDAPPPAIRKARQDAMEWITEQGSVVTLPRISFIECPRGKA